MIGPEYQARSVAAQFGPSRSLLFPEVMWGAWLDDTLAVLGETGSQIFHDSLEMDQDGVVNSAVVNAGKIPAGTIAYFAFMDAESGGNIIWYGTVTFDEPPTVGDEYVFDVGDLQLPYVEG